ncbi:hypothetical protein Godav_023294 [Gossypium davidsonii]|uniref:chitinase n=1 Tax=Gossypium davidsonii TaxID=34287 RepID=A0A7J8SR60_GOSDV|nr:hypothetical protein [Gossypium davidsonii]
MLNPSVRLLHSSPMPPMRLNSFAIKKSRIKVIATVKPIQSSHVHQGRNALKLDLLKNPEMVANDPVVSFKGSLWYWMAAVRPVIGQGFGATIKAINGRLECGVPAAQDKVQRRIRFYTDYCKQLGVDPGPKLSC